VEGSHASDTLCSVVAVTTRLVGAVGGMRSFAADRTDEPNNIASSKIRPAVNDEGYVLVMGSSSLRIRRG
jgi:hypothetical protein